MKLDPNLQIIDLDNIAKDKAAAHKRKNYDKTHRNLNETFQVDEVKTTAAHRSIVHGQDYADPHRRLERHTGKKYVPDQK